MSIPNDRSWYRQWWLGNQAGDVDEFLDEEFRASHEALRWILVFGAAFFLFRGLLEMVLIPTSAWPQDLTFRLVGCAFFSALCVIYAKAKNRMSRAMVFCVYLATYVSAAVAWAVTHEIHAGFLAVPMVLCLTVGVVLWPFFRGLYWPILAVAGPTFFLLSATGAERRDWMAYGLSLGVTALFSIVLRRARLRTSFNLFVCEKELRQQVDRDTLTGLLNLAGWRAKTHQFCQDQRSYPIAIVYFDIDHFKAVNDQHGHAVGDQVLVHTAKTLTSLLRSGDVLARVGGEEFVLALPSTSLENAEKLANRVRVLLSKNDSPVPVTISAGVAHMIDGVNLEKAMDLADRGLLEAKRQGRNRVCRAA